MTSSEKLVLCMLLSRANEAGQAWPSIGRVGKDTGLSPRQCHRAIRSLETRGIVHTSHRTLETGASSSSLFTLSIPVTDSHPPVTEGHPPVTDSHPPMTARHGGTDRMARAPMTVRQGEGDCMADKEIHLKQSIGSDPCEGSHARALDDETSAAMTPEQKPVKGMGRADSFADPEARIAVDAAMPDWASAAFDAVEGDGAVTFDRPVVWGKYAADRANPAKRKRAVNRADFSGWLWDERKFIVRDRVASSAKARSQVKQGPAQTAAAAEWRKEADG